MYHGRERTPRGGRPSSRAGYSNHSHSPAGDSGEKSNYTRDDGMLESRGRHFCNKSRSGSSYTKSNDTPKTRGTPNEALKDDFQSLSLHSGSIGSSPVVDRDQIELSSVEETESCAAILHHDLSNKVNISDSVDKSETSGPSQERSPQNSSVIDDSCQVKCQPVVEPFDICLPKIGTPVMLKPSLLVKIVRACRALGLGSGGFYQPGYRDGAKLHLRMMCLGKTGIQRQLVEKAIKDSHSLVQQKTKASHAEDIIPWMSPNICIVNFYSASGRLGLHQDKDESPGSLRKGLPVVSFPLEMQQNFIW
ncbi:2-oxoglutarate-dependent dioxygenase family protein, putative isoform 2 [Hibiscus syriacus]|uniref:2-oxoglutarate-dependent dioxygenase family protein, putative isoform 2 n=1 Tax=Hibiscus syriacus TaxID=106335 RepID=A0A6A2ZED6_HIBSY|nr:2-oxoglutarate-dependent dioxygenase family protein, putative isoform 2 [Hibiscus syriacus]